MENKIDIRAAIPEDVPLILQMVRELAEYEHESHSVLATPEDLLRDGWGPAPKFRCVLASWNQQPAGLALFFYNYSTWEGRPGIYLEDLFVRPQFRRHGIGRALLVHVAGIAVAENCGRFQWAVLDWNAPAIGFYQAMGATITKEWLPMRVRGEALKKLADGGE